MTDPTDEWEDVTAERARGRERCYRLTVTPEFAVELTVTERTRVEACSYELVLSTILEREGRHVSDHPVAGYETANDAREALETLKRVVADLVAERDDLPNPDRRLAHDAIPRFLADHADHTVCEPLYDPSLSP